MSLLTLPGGFIVGREFTTQGPIRPLAKGITRLDERLDLGAAFVNDCAFSVAQVTLHVIFVAEAIGTMDLDCFVGGTEGCLGGELLGKGCLACTAFSLVF